jgi:hypothetical protein
MVATLEKKRENWARGTRAAAESIARGDNTTGVLIARPLLIFLNRGDEWYDSYSGVDGEARERISQTFATNMARWGGRLLRCHKQRKRHQRVGWSMTCSVREWSSQFEVYCWYKTSNGVVLWGQPLKKMKIACKHQKKQKASKETQKELDWH